MDAFTQSLEGQAASNREAAVEREATVFDSVFSADGAYLISGARDEPLGTPAFFPCRPAR